MDRQGQHREMVYCHECENEWYRDEHGLTCPECHSDFTEIIESQNDPREDQDDLPDLEHNHPLHPLHQHNPWGDDEPPDPDEEDISEFGWRNTGPGRMAFSGRFTGTVPLNNQQGTHAQQNATANPMVDGFAALLGNILGGRPPSGQPGSPGPAPGQQQGAAPGARVYTGGGAGFTWTTTARLYPRDANQPQPHGQPLGALPNILDQMFGPDMQANHGNPGGIAYADMGPLGGLLAGLLNPANMQHGDAVYSQEALDRIVSQLMEQTTSGNAPGPASAEAIASLPEKSITESDLGDTGKADCSICMDEVTLGEKVLLLPCGHWFHGECVKAWLREHDTCPQCRSGIMPKDAPADSERSRRPGETPRHDQTWGQGEGTQANPWTVPDSPPQTRTSAPPAGPGGSDAGTGTGAQGTGGNDGLFGRMRNAFGGGN